jgi:hypothetical protein
MYDKVYIFWFVVDCLANSKIVGVTVNFTEKSVDISDGVRLFFGHEFAVADTLRVGEIARYYDPFVDNVFDVNMPTSTVSSLDCAATADALRHETTNMPLNASVATPAFMTPPSDMSHETTMPSSISILEDSNVLSSASPDSSAPAFMTDEGPSFPLVAESAGWNHLLDRKHFTQQIMSSWAGLQDLQQFKSDVHSLLDLANADLFESEHARCLDEYRTDKAQQLLKKISLLKHNKLAYAYTKLYFTAGHVSDQQCEGGMSAIKANGKLSLIANTTITGLCHYNNNDSNKESTRHFNGEIFQQVGNLNHLTTANRVSMLRQTWNDVEKIASKTALGHKLAMAALIETSNCLKSMNLTDTNSIIRPNAFSNSLR